MTNEIVPYESLERMAMAIAKSQLFGIKTPEQAIALMLVAQAEGLHPVTAARDYDIIQGRPAKKAQAMLRSFLANGGSVEWIRLDDTCAKATFSHPQGGEVTIEWDMERVKKAQISNLGMYNKYPRQMLRSRCVSEGIRTVCPMATSGMYVPEEVRDFDDDKPIKTVSAASPEEAKPKTSRLEAIVCTEKAAAPVEKKPVEVLPEPVKQPEAVVPPKQDDEIPAKATGVSIGKIEAIDSKSGKKKDGKAWTKWAVKVDGGWYGTFSETIANKLIAAKDADKTIQLYFSTRIVGDKKYNDVEAVLEMIETSEEAEILNEGDTLI